MGQWDVNGPRATAALGSVPFVELLNASLPEFQQDISLAPFLEPILCSLVSA
jgi:hypothetical protein